MDSDRRGRYWFVPLAGPGPWYNAKHVTIPLVATVETVGWALQAQLEPWQSSYPPAPGPDD